MSDAFKTLLLEEAKSYLPGLAAGMQGNYSNPLNLLHNAKKRKLSKTSARARQKSGGTLTTTKRRRRRKRGKKKYSKPFTKKQYKALKRAVSTTFVKREHQVEQTLQLTPGVNTATYDTLIMLPRSEMQDIFSQYTRIDDTGAISTDNIGGTNYNTKAKLYSLHSQCYMRNNSDLAVYVVVYNGWCKRDTDETPIARLESGLDDMNVNAAGTLESNVLTNPTDSHRFNEYFGLKNKQLYKIPAGESVRLTFNRTINKTVNARSFVSGKNEHMAGFTQFWMFKSYGDVGHAALSSSTIGFSDGTIDCVILHKYRYGVQDYDTPETIKVTDSLPAVTDPVQYTTTKEEATGDL